VTDNVRMDRVDLRFPMGNVVIALTQARLYGGLATHQLRISTKVSATWLDDKASEPLLLAGRVSSGHQFPHYVGDLVSDDDTPSAAPRRSTAATCSIPG